MVELDLACGLFSLDDAAAEAAAERSVAVGGVSLWRGKGPGGARLSHEPSAARDLGAQESAPGLFPPPLPQPLEEQEGSSSDEEGSSDDEGSDGAGSGEEREGARAEGGPLTTPGQRKHRKSRRRADIEELT